MWDYLNPADLFWLRGWFPWEEIHVRAGSDEEIALLNAFCRAGFASWIDRP